MKKALLLLSLLGLLAFSGCVSDNSTGLASVASSQNNEQISIPLEKIGEQAKFFEYSLQDTKIRFFAVRASDGSIKTAFDECDVCYYSKKGYRQEGDDMVCNNCGNRYPIEGLGTENRNPGGCWPSYLPNKIVGDSLTLEKADLEKGMRQFA